MLMRDSLTMTKKHPADTPRYREPAMKAGRHFIMRGMRGPAVMLNLLRFRAMADYAENPEFAPAG